MKILSSLRRKSLKNYLLLLAACTLYVCTVFRNEKNALFIQLYEIDQKRFLILKNSALQAACDTSIARGKGCIYPREGYRSVNPLQNARVNRTKTLSLALRTRKLKLYNPH